MKYFCYRRRDEFPVQLAYTIRYIGTVESAEEITKFVEHEIPDAEISFCGNTYCFVDSGRKVVAPIGSFLVLTAGKHFESHMDKDFFEEYFLS